MVRISGRRRATAAWGRLPVGPRFLAANAAAGTLVAAVFLAALVRTDPGGIGGLLLREGGAPVLGLLWLFLSLTFAGVQNAAALMLWPGEVRGPRGRALPVRPSPGAVPVRVAAPRRRR